MMTAKYKRTVSNLSAFGRPESHLTRQTAYGGIVTTCGVLLVIVLLFNELAHFLKQHRTTKMAVDLERRHDLTVVLDMSFPAVPCAALSIDVLDISGTAENDATVSTAKGMNIHKMRLDQHGRKIGKREYLTPQSQHLVESGSNSLVSVNIAAARKHVEDMEEEFANNEGCHISGHMTVRRVAGKIFISAHQHQVFQMLPQLLGTHHVPKVSNLSHVVHRVGFGPAYPGQVNPLDGYSRVMTDATYAFKYFLKVVPTEYYSRLGRVTETHQYSVTEYTARLDGGGAQPPSVEMSYDLSPIVMTVNERPPSILHFLVRLCAVVGGAFAVTGMADKWIHNLVLMLGALPAGPRATRSARPTQQ